MVRKNQQRRIVVDLRHDLAEHLINLLVKLLQRRPVLSGERGVIRRTLRIGQTPHHVRIQIKAGEIKEKQTIVKLRKFSIERAPMLCQHRV